MKIKKERWVIYKGEINASKITSDWFSWIHHTSILYQTKKNKKNIHGKNLILTIRPAPLTHRPNKIKKKKKEFKKYESWKP